MFYQVFSGPTCFPLPIQKNANFSSSDVNITTTLAVSLQIGNYLYSTTNNQLKKIISIGNSGSSFVIESAFNTDVVNDAVNIADASIDYYEVDIFNFGGASGLLNGEEYPNNLIANVKKENDSLVFTIDGTGTKISLLGLV